MVIFCGQSVTFSEKLSIPGAGQFEKACVVQHHQIYTAVSTGLVTEPQSEIPQVLIVCSHILNAVAINTRQKLTSLV